jgi:hypothetical protein
MHQCARYKLETEGVSEGTRCMSYSTLVGRDKERLDASTDVTRLATAQAAVCCRDEGHAVVTLQDEGK